MRKNKDSPFFKPLTAFPLRRETQTLIQPADIYSVLAALQVGDVIPVQVYISDYDTGTIPPWTIRAKKDEDGSFFVLTLTDANSIPKQPDLLESATQYVAIDVLAQPARVLATPHYLLGKEGYGPRPMLHDLAQQVRVLNKTYRST